MIKKIQNQYIKIIKTLSFLIFLISDFDLKLFKNHKKKFYLHAFYNNKVYGSRGNIYWADIQIISYSTRRYIRNFNRNL